MSSATEPGVAYSAGIVPAESAPMPVSGVKVAVDPISQEFLEGCTIEFIQELGSNYFQITNPKATAKCGCGNSFTVKGDTLKLVLT